MVTHRSVCFLPIGEPPYGCPLWALGQRTWHQSSATLVDQRNESQIRSRGLLDGGFSRGRGSGTQPFLFLDSPSVRWGPGLRVGLIVPVPIMRGSGRKEVIGALHQEHMPVNEEDVVALSMGRGPFHGICEAPGCHLPAAQHRVGFWCKPAHRQRRTSRLAPAWPLPARRTEAANPPRGSAPAGIRDNPANQGPECPAYYRRN